MASIAFVKALVLRLNHIMYCDGPREMQIPCEGSSVVAVEYWNPNICNGVQDPTYCYTPSQDPAVAQSDTIKTLRVVNKFDNNTYWVIIDMADDESKFTDNCNACCGTTPDMTTGIVIPVPNVEDTGIVNPANGISTFKFPVPNNPYTGTDYLITAISYNNGLKPAAVPLAVGYASVADVVIWLNTNASVMGVWSAINNNTLIQLVGASGVTTVGFAMALEPQKYCLDLPVTPVTIEVITFIDPINPDINVKIPPLVLSEANRAGVLAAMQQHLIGTVSLFASGGTNWKMNYTGVQHLRAVKSADLTTVIVSFTVGPCV